MAAAPSPSPPRPALRPTVVLCCAADDAGSLTAVMRQLVASGIRVDVVSDLELDVRPLQSAIDRRRPRSLFVVCTSDELDPYQADLLCHRLRSAGLAEEHHCKIQFDRGAADAFAAAVLEHLCALAWVITASSRPRLRLVTPLSIHGIAVADRVDVAPEPHASSDPLAAAKTAERRAQRPAAVARRGRKWVVLGVGSAIVAALAALVWPDAEPTEPSPAASLATASAAVGITDRRARPLERDHGSDAAGAPGLPPALASKRNAEREDASPMMQALRSKEIRALDMLLVTYPATEGLRRAQAIRACRGFEKLGLEAWRLPSRGELDALAEAGFVSNGSSWWVGGRRFTRRRMLWTGKSLRAKRAGRRTHAAVVCVTEAGS